MPVGRDAVAPGGQHVAGRAESGDVRGPGHAQGRLRAVGAAGGEVRQGSALRRHDAAGRLGCQQGLILYLVDYDGFGELGGDDGRGHFQYGFVGEEQAALGHGAHAAAESEIAQVFQELFRENAGVAQVIDAGVAEGQGGQTIDRVIHAGGDQVAAVGWVFAHVEAEGGFALHTFGEVGLCHGQLVEIGEQADVAGRHGEMRLFAVAGHGSPLPPAMAMRG